MNYLRFIPTIAKAQKTSAVPFRFPSCNNCIYHENGYCKLFKYQFITEKTPVEHYVHANVAREHIDLCSPEGIYFKSKIGPFVK